MVAVTELERAVGAGGRWRRVVGRRERGPGFERIGQEREDREEGEGCEDRAQRRRGPDSNRRGARIVTKRLEWCGGLSCGGLIIPYEEYHPYGSTAWWAATSSTVPQKRYRYNGKENDEESGLYYYGARFYLPWLARWTSADPTGLEGGTNRFCYVSCSPVVRIDPNGTTDVSTNDVDEMSEQLAASMREIGLESNLTPSFGGPPQEPPQEVLDAPRPFLRPANSPSNESIPRTADEMVAAAEDRTEAANKSFTRPGFRSEALMNGLVLLPFEPVFFAWSLSSPEGAQNAEDARNSLRPYEYKNDDQARMGQLEESVAQTVATFAMASAGPRLASRAAAVLEGGVAGSLQPVTVTSWASTGISPDLNAGRWVQLGGPTKWNYLKSGLIGPKAYSTGTFPYVRVQGPNVPFANSITGQVPASSLRLPPGVEVWKGVLGQRVIK